MPLGTPPVDSTTQASSAPAPDPPSPPREARCKAPPTRNQATHTELPFPFRFSSSRSFLLWFVSKNPLFASLRLGVIHPSPCKTQAAREGDPIPSRVSLPAALLVHLSL